MSGRPIDVLLAALGSPPLDQEARARLDRLLEEGLRGAREICPALAIDAEPLLLQLADRLREAPELELALSELRLDWLLVARACVAGETHAIATLDHILDEEVRRLVRLSRPPGVAADELLQRLRERLLVGSSPRIATYSGKGELRVWVRVIASRILADLLGGRRAERNERPLEEAGFAELVAPGPDQETRLLIKRNRPQLEAALKNALKGLSPRQRNLLRYQCFDNMSLDELAQIYRVHRVTIFRWLGAARQLLVTGTQRELQRRLRLSRSEGGSLLRALQGQLDLSLESSLGRDEEGEP